MKRGFTLIELLMAIAIIAILAVIVVSQIGSSRNKAIDAKIKAHVYEAKNAAELYFGVYFNYGSANVSQATGGASCTGSMFTDQSSGMSAYGNSVNYPGGTNLICVQNLSAFAFAASMSVIEDYWCVDSIGSPGLITISNPGNILSSDDSCPKMDAK